MCSTQKVHIENLQDFYSRPCLEEPRNGLNKSGWSIVTHPVVASFPYIKLIFWFGLSLVE